MEDGSFPQVAHVGRCASWIAAFYRTIAICGSLRFDVHYGIISTVNKVLTSIVPASLMCAERLD